MPWCGPSEPGEFASLGHVVADWIEANCVIPDGPDEGKQFRLTDEQYRFLLFHYRLRPDAVYDPYRPSAPWVYTESMLVRPQKWGKGPLSAAIICAEAAGPVLFAGWDAAGEAVGIRWPTPRIQLLAASMSQTDNIWACLVPMIRNGPLAAVIADVGVERINLPNNGKIERVTLSSKSRLGARLTLAMQDETHSLTDLNGGVATAQTQGRNAAGYGGRTIQTTNVWDPGEDSVAKRTHETHSAAVYIDTVTPPDFDSSDPVALAKTLEVVYGDSYWVDKARIADDHRKLAQYDRSQADRFFCNVISKGAAAAFDPVLWASLAKPELIIPDGERIVLGFDGARFHDTTALIATHLETGHQWPVSIWERPAHLGDLDDWEIDGDDVLDSVTEAFDTWKVHLLYADPPHWESNVDAWAGRWGGKKVKAWWTNRVRPMGFALRAYVGAMNEGSLSHSDDPRFNAHIGNSCRKMTNIRDDDGRFMWILRKSDAHSKAKIDAAMAGCLSWEARGDAIAAGALKPKRQRVIYSF